MVLLTDHVAEVIVHSIWKLSVRESLNLLCPLLLPYPLPLGMVGGILYRESVQITASVS